MLPHSQAAADSNEANSTPQRRGPASAHAAEAAQARRSPWALAKLLVVLAFGAAATAAAAIEAPAQAPTPSGLFAERLDAENVARLRVGGPDAVAGVGDWVVGNGTLCAAIADPEHEIGLTHRGGVLVDLGHCGRSDDQFGVLQPLLNLSRSQAVSVESVRAEVSADEARIVTRGAQSGLEIETTYFVDHLRPDRLGIRSEIRRVGEGERLFLFGDVVLHGNRQLTAWTASLAHPELSVGFAHPEVDMVDFLRTARALVRADLQVLVSAPEVEQPISYGWRSVRAERVGRGGERLEIETMALDSEHFSMLAHLSRPPWIGGHAAPGLFELAQSAFMDVGPGETLVSEREIVIAPVGDVASITSRAWSGGPRIHGWLGETDARIHVRDASGVPVTFVSPGADGHFAFRLPPARSGPYEVEVQTPDGRKLRRTIAAPPEGVDLGRLDLQPPAIVEIPPMGPVRLVFEGIEPTVDPVFGADLMHFSLGARMGPAPQARNHVSMAGAPGDPERVLLPSGRYRVYATRGMEHSVTEAIIEARPGLPVRLVIEPPSRVVSLPGFVSADLHVHAAPSDDASLPIEQRLRDFAATAAEVLVSTDHDRAVDYAPIIDRMGLGQRITSIVGSELTSTAQSEVSPFTIGHANAFPLRPDGDAFREGIPAVENRRLRDVVAELRARPGRPVLQLNHPREGGVDGGNGAYLSHLGHVGRGHVPTQPLGGEANASLVERAPGSGLRDLDFDAIELLNASDLVAYALTRADWVSWMLQGELRTGTANSDTHDAARPPALPRNYVAYDGGMTDAFDETAFVDALRAGRAFGTTGPLLQVSLAGAGPGDMVSTRDAVLSISVQAAPWIPVDSLFVYQDGRRVYRARIVPGQPALHRMQFAADAIVFVEVVGRASDSAVYRAVAPGFTPFAFTNPIRVDADGDGVWTAPGLPAEPIPVLHSPALPRPLPRTPGARSDDAEAPSAG